MPRIRMIKPEFFDDPDVADLTFPARILFIGLWTLADKDGFLEDDLRRIKANIFPHDQIDIGPLTAELHGKDMIRRFPAVEKHGWIWVRNFTKHQNTHPKEKASLRPDFDLQAGKLHGQTFLATVQPGDPTSTSTSTSDPASTSTGGVVTKTAPPVNGNGKHPVPLGLRSEHRNHAICGTVCLPSALFSDFLLRARNEPDPAAYVTKFFHTWNSRYVDGDRKSEIIGEDAFVFWRERWAEAHPTLKGKQKSDEAERQAAFQRSRAEVARGEERRKALER